LASGYSTLANGVQATEPMNLFHFGALFGPDLIEHPTHLWRLVTPIFVHIDWEHFLLTFFTDFYRQTN
jgi:membrane associated rhomboid family serine protease